MPFLQLTRQTFNYATPIFCDEDPQNVLTLHLDKYEDCASTPKPVLRATPTLFEPNEVQCAIK